MNQFFIFSAIDVIVLLRHLTNTYVASNDNPVVNSALKFDRTAPVDPKKAFSVLPTDAARDITIAILNDVIESKMNWIRGSNGNDQLIAAVTKHFPDFTQSESNSNLHASNHFFSNVIDEAMLACEQIIAHFIPEATWNIWSLHLFGSDFVLEKGNDYRIVDWTRRMASGEWSDRVSNDFLHCSTEEINRISTDDIKRDNTVKEVLHAFLTQRYGQSAVIATTE